MASNHKSLRAGNGSALATAQITTALPQPIPALELSSPIPAIELPFPPLPPPSPLPSAPLPPINHCDRPLPLPPRSGNGWLSDYIMLAIVGATLLLVGMAAAMWPSIIPVVLAIGLTGLIAGPYMTGQASPARKGGVLAIVAFGVGALVFGALDLWALVITLTTGWLFAERLLSRSRQPVES